MFNRKLIQPFLAAGLLTVICLLIGLAFAQQTSLALNPPAIQSLKPVAAAAPNLTGAYRGTITMRSPIPVGSLDFAVNIVGSGSALTGRISISRTLIYDNIPELTGSLANSTAITPTFTLTSAPFTNTISGRAVQRQLAFSGYVIQAGEVLSGTLQETITGFTPQPLIARGTFMAVRPPTNVPSALTLQVGAIQINPGQQTTIIATVNDQTNQPLPGVVVIFQSTLGTFSVSNGVTNNQGQVSTTFAAGTVTGAAKVTILAEAVAARSQIQIGQLATPTPTVTNTPLPTATFTPVTPTATKAATPTATQTPIPLAQVPLYTGWNLVAIPAELATPVPSVLFAPIAGNYNLVYAYNGCDTVDPWKKYDPVAPFPFLNDLSRVAVSQGLWIRATQNSSLPVPGVDPTNTSIQLCTGWNLMAWPGGAPTAVNTALANIAGKYTLVYAYDASDPADPWKKYDPAAPFPFLNDLHELKPGLGYWIRIATPTTLVVP